MSFNKRRSVNCVYFLKGTCNKGEGCDFIHPKTPSPLISFGPPRVCTFFSRNACTRGQECPYLHELPAVPSGAARQQVGVVPGTPCRFWLKSGSCARGNQCFFTHDAPPPLPSTPHTSSPPIKRVEMKSFEDTPCAFWKRGECDKGDTCKFVHTALKISNPKSPKQTTIEKSQECVCERPVITSLRATFGAGAEILGVVITGFESRRLILGNLPPAISHRELLQILSPFNGVTSAAISTAAGETTAAMATVDFLEVRQAADAATGLSSSNFRGNRVSARLDTRAVDGGIIRNRTVSASWFSPSVIAWAHYSSLERARKRSQELNGRVFKGRKIACSLQPTSSRKTPTVSIVITGLPSNSTVEDLRPFFRADSVKIGPATYDYDASINIVRKLLASFGPLESFDPLPHKPKDKKVKALARFSNADAAMSAVATLHNETPPLIRSPLWISLVQSVKYRLPALQYAVQKQEISDLRDSAGNEIQLRINDLDSRGIPADPIFLRLYGEDSKILGHFKGKLEKILAGEKVMRREEWLWDDYFHSQAGKNFLAHVQAASGAFIICDPRKRSLSSFGESKTRSLASRMINDEMNRLESQRFIIPLERASLTYLLAKGGLSELQAKIGVDVLSLNVVERSIMINGGPEALHTVKLALETATAQGRPTLASESDCPICFCEVTAAITLACGHVFCTACLHHYLSSVAQNKIFPVKCLGGDGLCQECIPLTTIRTILSPLEEDRLFEASALTYIHCRPEQFKFCPTPDCPQIYRPSDDGTSAQCPICLSRICLACHVEQHDGFTCAEQRRSTAPDDEAFLTWKKSNNVKPCPECNVDIEKNGGCNHMTCFKCQAHICWVCMSTFPAGTDVYPHMNSAHGL